VANLAAANCFTKEHYQSSEIQKAVQMAKYFYCEGYFLTVSTDTMVEVGRHAKETNKVVPFPFSLFFFCSNSPPSSFS
jgi:adenosine kinase